VEQLKADSIEDVMSIFYLTVLLTVTIPISILIFVINTGWGLAFAYFSLCGYIVTGGIDIQLGLSYRFIMKNKICHFSEALSYAIILTLCKRKIFTKPITYYKLNVKYMDDLSVNISCKQGGPRQRILYWDSEEKKLFSEIQKEIFYQNKAYIPTMRLI
jgi:hypothetical protein